MRVPFKGPDNGGLGASINLMNGCSFISPDNLCSGAVNSHETARREEWIEGGRDRAGESDWVSEQAKTSKSE